MGADSEGAAAAGWQLWLLEPMSSTHNEFRLAACPLSGVPSAFARPLSTNTQAIWKVCRFGWHAQQEEMLNLTLN